MSELVLSLRDFGVSFGERVILSAVTLDVSDRGLVVLMGPAGTGKSTLLRTLAGFNSANPSLCTWGKVQYAGARLDETNKPALVSQSARLMMASVFDNLANDLPERHMLTRLQQRDIAKRLLGRAGLEGLIRRLDEPVVKLPLGLQRHLAILRLIAAGPNLLCIDEPTTGVDEAYCPRLLDYIRQESKRRAILVVLHNQKHARRLGGETALLAGGRIQEMRATPEFFKSPRSQAAKDFVRSGSCSVASPNAKREELDSGVEPPPPVPKRARKYLSDSFGPRGFLWLKKGVLAGTPRPGIVADLDYDLKALRRVGIGVLVSLTQSPIDPQILRKFEIEGIWLPVPDMGVPGIEQAKELCRCIHDLTAAGEAIAVHCRAGLGRTGTVLAAYLIWEGASALNALEGVRRVEPRWVQSDEQVAFLEEFAQAVAKEVPLQCSGTSNVVVPQLNH